MKSLFLFFACCSFYFLNATVLKEDSLKNEYDIKDPRNPQCACHKYQKLADDEYRKSFGKEIKLGLSKSETNYTNTFSGSSEVSGKNKIKTKKFHSIKRIWSFFSFKKKKTSKRKRLRRFKKDNTTCFHF